MIFAVGRTKSAIAARKELTVGLLIRSRIPCHDGRRGTQACAFANPGIDGGDHVHCLVGYGVS